MSESSSAQNQSMFSVEDFPANPTPLLADEKALRTNATCGQSSPDSFAKLGPDGSWLKTCQGYSQMTLDGSLEAFCETWPRAGMTRNGTAYRLPPLAPLTDVIASGLWPTPQTTYDGRTDEAWQRAKAEKAAKHRAGEYGTGTGAPGMMDLQRAVRMWPTPTARDHKSDSCSAAFRARRDAMTMGKTLPWVVGGLLNPTWVEWLMGYPTEWTVCEGWGTRSSRRSRNGSGAASSKRTKG